ncbi:DUF2290 domain-containing protein [Promicromonospora soli]
MSQWITNITTKLVETGLVDDQNFPVTREHNGVDVVTYPNANGSLVLGQSSYRDLYELQYAEDAYNLRMLDGALVQMSYEFRGSQIETHRLAFLPSPDLLEYQNDPELYLGEWAYADVVGGQALPVPIRLDFDGRPGVARNLVHPVTHLTLGQYQNCRIPATSPMTPGLFLDFIVRHFYTGMADPGAHFDLDFANGFDSSITDDERRLIHLHF